MNYRTNVFALLIFVFQLNVSYAFVVQQHQPNTRIQQCRDVQVPYASPNDNETPSITTTGESSRDVLCPNCDLCDGSGRIPGGIGAVFPWIPIKAYRPCPNFINRGGFYERAGQGLDEIAFGRDSTFTK